jgi:1-aminocyclopropane-1-carboxylate deaminase
MNDMLAFEESMGMRLHFVSRDQYRAKAEPMFIEALRHLFGDFYLIPEGGSNDLGVKGCEEFAHELDHESGFDYLCLPVGTGATMAGLANALPNRKIIGISVLKGGEFLKHEVGKFLKRDAGNWELFPDFHFGGYGKVSRQLVGFITDFEHQHKIPLDPVYTAKMFFGVMELVKGGYFPKGARVLLLHTGGLQGRKGFNF